MAKKSTRHYMKGRSRKAGLPPGSLVPIGEKQAGPTGVQTILYNGHDLVEYDAADAAEAFKKQSLKGGTRWVNVDSVHDPHLLAPFGELLHLHPLMMEDILNTDQRPKFEDLDQVLYVVIKVIDLTTRNAHTEIQAEQISFVIGKDYLLTFQEEPGDEFEVVRQRLRVGQTRLRQQGADYLAYELIDAVVDYYFKVLERLGDDLELLETQLNTSVDRDVFAELHRLRHEMIFLRKSVWPLREVVNAMMRTESPLVTETTRRYLRDVYDHTIQVIDTVETYRDVVSGLQDLYLSLLSNRMNEVMKVLTIIATIFIPLTFITSIYGMNFRYMPELEQPWGYPAIMLLMLLIGLGMVIYFKRQRWF